MKCFTAGLLKYSCEKFHIAPTYLQYLTYGIFHRISHCRIEPNCCCRTLLENVVYLLQDTLCEISYSILLKCHLSAAEITSISCRNLQKYHLSPAGIRRNYIYLLQESAEIPSISCRNPQKRHLSPAGIRRNTIYLQQESAETSSISCRNP